MWLSEQSYASDWPKDPRLDIFRDSVWRLSLDGELAGWLTTAISPMRTFPVLWRKREGMWTQVHWIDGRRSPQEEDYGPNWWTAEELRGGSFSIYDQHVGKDLTLEAVRVTGAERHRLWNQLDHQPL